MRTQFTMVFASAAALALAACSDPMTPQARRAAVQPQFAVQGQGRSALDLIEADIDAGLLDRENGNRYRQYAVSEPAGLPARYRSGGIGKDATLSMVRPGRGEYVIKELIPDMELAPQAAVDKAT